MKLVVFKLQYIHAGYIFDASCEHSTQNLRDGKARNSTD